MARPITKHDYDKNHNCGNDSAFENNCDYDNYYDFDRDDDWCIDSDYDENIPMTMIMTMR